MAVFAALLGAAGVGRAACPDLPSAPALELPVSRAALADHREWVVLAFGSSSTEGAGASAPGLTYPARLEAMLRRAMPGVSLRVLNRGRGGEDATEMLVRLEAEVIAVRPDLVIWQAGANAALRGHDPETFRRQMESGLDRLAAADVVLMDSQLAPRLEAVPNFPRFGEVLAELAAARPASLFSRTAAMRDWAQAGVPPTALLIGDGLHHNDRGYECVAEALATAILAGIGQPAMVAASRR